nr:DUF4031 domain-containing protein [Kineococcus rubinsiae]
MSVLVDSARWPAHGRLWAHLVSDSSLAELHAFAAALGVPPRSFEGDHYDVPAERVAEAVAAGAESVSTRELLLRLRAAGLRTPKRRGEKVVASDAPDDAGASGPMRVDLVLSDRVPGPHGEHLVTTAAGLLVGSVREVGDRRVLGFRRTWSRTPAGVEVRHEGVLLAGPGDTASHGTASGETVSGESAQGPGWWVPLLSAS